MAKLIVNDQEKEIPDNTRIVDACEELGVPMSCKEGICNMCKVQVVEGMENLNDKTDNEVTQGLEGNERLACQCTIKQGTVKLTF